MKKLLSIICLCSSLASLANGVDGKVINTDSLSISNAKITAFSATRDSIAATLTNESGFFNIPDSNVAWVLISHKDYSDKLVTVKSPHLGEITLTKPQELDEIVVTPSEKTEHIDHDSYVLSRDEMKNYNNLYDALNIIPGLVIFPDYPAYFQGSDNILFLLNGNESNKEELKTIDRNDVLRVDVYSTPPLRYMQYSAVIDVILRNDIIGGNVYVGFDDQFNKRINTDHTIAAYYYHNRSRFAVIANNSLLDSKRTRTDDTLSYTFQGEDYSTTRKQLDGTQYNSANNLTLSYQNRVAGEYMYSLTGGIDFSRSHDYQLQSAENNHGLSFFTTSRNRNGYDNIWGRLLTSNHFGDNPEGNTLNVHFYYSRYNTKVYSSYAEHEDKDITTPESDIYYTESNNRSLSYLYSGYLQYEFVPLSFGKFSTYVQGYYQSNKSKLAENPFFTNKGQVKLFAALSGRAAKFFWYGRVGLTWYSSKTYLQESSYRHLFFEPYALLYYYPSNSSSLQLSYRYYGHQPGIDQMSETEQWIDEHVVYQGNALLKPAKTHTVTLEARYWNKYIDLTFNNQFTYSKGYICLYYVDRPEYILQTYTNFRNYYGYVGSLQTSIFPLGNRKWTIGAIINSGVTKGENESYKWNGWLFQMMLSSSVNIKKWSFAASYQYPGKVVMSQLIRPRAQYWSVSAYFRPIDNMNIGLKWMQPFGKDFKESEYTVKSSPVQTNHVTHAYGWVNGLCISFSYNFSFGRQPNDQNVLGKADSDSGILKK